MTYEQIVKFDNLFKNSILYGLENIDFAVDYAMKYSRGQSKDVITQFIKMYVNDVTVNMGTKGEASIKKMFEMGMEKGLIQSISMDFA